MNATCAVPNHGSGSGREKPVFVPAAEIYETPDAVLVRCDMPGVDEADVEITLGNKVLTVTGRQQDVAGEKPEVLVREYPTGIYQRSFSIERELDESAVKARLKHGVLEVELPKSKNSGLRRIPVTG